VFTYSFQLLFNNKLWEDEKGDVFTSSGRASCFSLTFLFAESWLRELQGSLKPEHRCDQIVVSLFVGLGSLAADGHEMQRALLRLHFQIPGDLAGIQHIVVDRQTDDQSAVDQQSLLLLICFVSLTK